MEEPIIVCPSCSAPIRLTESLAAPLIAATKLQYEKKIALKEVEVSSRESALKEQQQLLEKARESVEEQVAAKMKEERTRIASEESRKGDNGD
jgi:hypothetical protein